MMLQVNSILYLANGLVAEATDLAVYSLKVGMSMPCSFFQCMTTLSVFSACEKSGCNSLTFFFKTSSTLFPTG